MRISFGFVNFEYRRCYQRDIGIAHFRSGDGDVDQSRKFVESRIRMSSAGRNAGVYRIKVIEKIFKRPKFELISCREQRVTGLLVFIFIGLSVFMTKVLKVKPKLKNFFKNFCVLVFDAFQFIPMPVLYGVFLYMGLSSLRGVQMIDRLLLLIIPMKYQPDYVYLRHVPIKRVHLFTVFQLGCFIVLCIVKEIEITSIVFPIMVRRKLASCCKIYRKN